MEDNVISIPLPILAAVLCTVIAPLMLRLDLGRREANWCFAVLFASFALQSVMVGLRFGYGVERFITFQRVLPLSVGPLLYLGFLSLSLPAARFRRQAYAHMGLAVALMVVLAGFANIYRDFDLVISASYLIYTGLLITLWRRGQDHLIFAKLDQASAVQRWMVLAAALLIGLLALDTIIALNFIFAQGAQATIFVTIGSAMLIGLLLLVLVNLPTRLARKPNGQTLVATDAQSDAELLEKQARELLNSTQIYLDPDLTVQRLARRLTVPERNLSMAINQTQGMNVSQYVNGFRLAHAAQLLRESSDSVSKVMLQSGFLTRSNFYREFQRVYQQTPAQYRKEHSG